MSEVYVTKSTTGFLVFHELEPRRRRRMNRDGKVQTWWDSDGWCCLANPDDWTEDLMRFLVKGINLRPGQCRRMQLTDVGDDEPEEAEASNYHDYDERDPAVMDYGEVNIPKH